MKPLTIRDLHKMLSSIMKNQPEHADDIILVSDDEEQNGYHGLYEHKMYIGEPMSYIDGKTGIECVCNTLTIG